LSILPKIQLSLLFIDLPKLTTLIELNDFSGNM